MVPRPTGFGGGLAAVAIFGAASVVGFELEVDPVGSTGACRTGAIDVVPGDVVVLSVASSLRLSSWYPR